VLGATLADTWTVARAMALRAGGDPGYPGLSGPIELPAARQPRRIALLETPGWPEASAAAKPTSLLGVPSLLLPVFEDDGLPLGQQLVGFTDRDADVFSVARAIMALLAD